MRDEFLNRSKLRKNCLIKVINTYNLQNNIQWKPDKTFYKLLGIGQKRFGFLLRNEVEITFVEITALSNYFNIPESEILEFETQTVINPSPTQDLPEKKSAGKESGIKEWEKWLNEHDGYSRNQVKSFFNIGNTAYAKWIKTGRLKQEGEGKWKWHKKKDVEHLLLAKN